MRLRETIAAGDLLRGSCISRCVVEVALNRFAHVVAQLLDGLRLGVDAEAVSAGGVAAIDFVVADLEDDLGFRRQHNHLRV